MARWEDPIKNKVFDILKIKLVLDVYEWAIKIHNHLNKKGRGNAANNIKGFLNVMLGTLKILHFNFKANSAMTQWHFRAAQH